MSTVTNLETWTMANAKDLDLFLRSWSRCVLLYLYSQFANLELPLLRAMSSGKKSASSGGNKRTAKKKQKASTAGKSPKT